MTVFMFTGAPVVLIAHCYAAKYHGGALHVGIKLTHSP
jgi:hypothetical protein